MKITMPPQFFATSSELRNWLARHHDQIQELWVGFYKKDSGKPSVTWPEVVDAALSFGWIDGIRKSLDDISYTCRITPRNPRSAWSAVNIKKAQELIKLGLMHPAGLKAFQVRAKEGIYSYEQRRNLKFDPAYEKKLKADRKAHEFFQAQAPWYQRTSAFWVMSAKKEETKLNRLATLIACSRDGQTIKPLTRPAGGTKAAPKKQTRG
jgi:uncharacterized protein YdeI (YjbR/CyaY-like superfamily)